MGSARLCPDERDNFFLVVAQSPPLSALWAVNEAKESFKEKLTVVGLRRVVSFLLRRGVPGLKPLWLCFPHLLQVFGHLAPCKHSCAFNAVYLKDAAEGPQFAP